MPLTIPTDWELRGGQIISPCTGSNISVPISYCQDLKGCGVAEYRAVRRAGTIVNVSQDINGCLVVRPKFIMSMKILALTAGPDAITGPEVTTAFNLILNGTGLVLRNGAIAPGFALAVADASAVSCALA